MSRLIWLLLLPLVACADGTDDEASIAYEGPSKLTVGPEDRPNDLSDRSALAAHEGVYGVSSADCDPDNRYMTEYIEVTNVGFAYRGELLTLAEIIDDDAFRFSASDGSVELIRFDDGNLVRWPDDRAARTVYRRCA